MFGVWCILCVCVSSNNFFFLKNNKNINIQDGWFIYLHIKTSNRDYYMMYINIYNMRPLRCIYMYKNPDDEDLVLSIHLSNGPSFCQCELSIFFSAYMQNKLYRTVKLNEWFFNGFSFRWKAIGWQFAGNNYYCRYFSELYIHLRNTRLFDYYSVFVLIF